MPTNNSQPVVDFENATIEISSSYPLENINLKISSGELIYLNGSALSSGQILLKSIYGAWTISSGKAEVLSKNIIGISENDLSELRQNMGLMIQHPMLLDHLNVFQNMELAYWIKCRQKNVSSSGIDHWLKEFNLEPNTRVSQLDSRQKIYLQCAMALLNDPKLFLCENILDRHDTEIKRMIMSLLVEMARNRNMTIIVSTEDVSMMKQFPGRIIHDFQNANLAV